MDQVSRPVLIALVATIALVAVWLIALRPKPVAVENTPLAPTQAIPAAKQASAASDAANAKLQAAAKADGSPSAPAPADKPATGGAEPKSAAKATSPSAAQRGETQRERVVLRQIRQGKVVVMLFWSPDGADDVATRGAIRTLNLRRGKVKVHVVPIGDVADYGSITRGVKVVQSPTTLIIDRDGRTRTIVGLTEPQELGQAVGDAIAKR